MSDPNNHREQPDETDPRPSHVASRHRRPDQCILADDLGIGNVGCYGADNYKTPHIDALASGGIRYTRAYTAPLCGPSRTWPM